MSVRGAVVDVAFAHGALPPIDTALVVNWNRPAPLVLEAHSHVDTHTVRGIAMQATPAWPAAPACALPGSRSPSRSARRC